MSATSDFEARLTPRELEEWLRMRAEAPAESAAEVLRQRQRREAFELAAREYVDGKISPAQLAERAANGT